MSQKTCKQCGKLVPLNDQSRAILAKMSLPEPALCDSCSMQQLMSFRNERTFYSSKCQKCEKTIIGMYPSNTPYIVWCRDCWWSDTWDAKEFGLEYKGPETFFEQMKELQRKVPREGLVSLNTENCDYSNHIRDSKDCYMCVGIADGSEKLFYCYGCVSQKFSSDVVWGKNSELVYNSIFAYQSYNCSYVIQAEGCTDCHYCFDIKNSTDCMFSSGLRNKQYVFRNKQLTKEAYEAEIAKINFGSYKEREEHRKEFQNVINNAIHKFSNQTNSQNSTGENIHNSANTQRTYGGFDNEDIFNGANVLNAKNIVYGFAVGTQPVEWGYLISVTKGGMNVVGCSNTVFSNDIFYCENVVSSSDCIGCIGLNKKSYCILNKQYSEEDYKKIKAELLSYWKNNGQLSEFLPKELSCFGYNETPAQDFYPLTKEQAIRWGYKWQDNMPTTHGKETITAAHIPDDIVNMNESICNEVLACKTCGRNYKIIKPELALYKQLHAPVPRECFDCRHKERVQRMGGRTLHDRSCSCTSLDHGHAQSCPNKFESIYQPGKAPAKVFCESCYQKEVA